MVFTRSIKKQIFSLEPREIGLLVRQQKAMMESIYEGVIAIDDHLRIEVINRAARKLLGLNQPARQLRGQPIGGDRPRPLLLTANDAATGHA